MHEKKKKSKKKEGLQDTSKKIKAWESLHWGASCGLALGLAALGE